MNSSLQEFGNIIADQCVFIAHKYINDLIDCIDDIIKLRLTDNENREILLAFTFMNYCIASGVWSNIKNTKLRRDLMTVTKDALIIKLATELNHNNQSKNITADIAADSVKIYFDQFQPYMKFHLERLKNLHNTFIDFDANFDANSTMLVALEWIQSRLNLDGSSMNLIIPAFMPQTEKLDEIEKIAETVNKALLKQNKE